MYLQDVSVLDNFKDLNDHAFYFLMRKEKNMRWQNTWDKQSAANSESFFSFFSEVEAGPTVCLLQWKTL